MKRRLDDLMERYARSVKETARITAAVRELTAVLEVLFEEQDAMSKELNLMLGEDKEGEA